MKLLLTFTFASFVAISSYGQAEIPKEINTLLTKNMCSSCHKLDEKLIGPSYKELASTKMKPKEIAALIVEPKPSNWPDYPPMAAMPYLKEDEVKKMAEWIASLSEE